MVNPSLADGGALAIAGGMDATGQPVWQVVLDTSSLRVTLDTGASSASASLPTAIAWHTVEVALDASGSAGTLYLNGIERAALSSALSATRYAWLGAAFVEPGLNGTIDFDHWVLADAPIGVAASTPTLDHGGDPRRWLVVYNRNNADSARWADIYRGRRGVPYTNLCGLDLPSTETISAAEYEAMRQGINDYLDNNNLRSQVVGVLLGYGVPGYSDVLGQGALVPTSAYLHSDDTHGSLIVNPLYQNPVTTRSEASDYGSVRLTGRIDAASLSDAVALLDRADAIIAEPLRHDGFADFIIDINPDNPLVGPVFEGWVSEWANGASLTSLRLPSTIYDDTAPASVSRESVVWGWRDAAPTSGFFAEPGGRRVLCIQLDPVPTPAVTLREPAAADWLTTALGAGFAAAAAPSRSYSLSALPLPGLFFEALRLGWTLAEAWMVAQAFLREGLQVVGDPLMTVGFPKAGYDVYGHASRLDQADLSTPIALLHAGERSFTPDTGDLPDSGTPSRYLVRRIDDAGRSDHASAAAFVAVDGSSVVRPALPAWPTRDSWRVARRSGQLQLSASWPVSMRALGIEMVQLFLQEDEGDPVVVDQTTPDPGQKLVCFSASLPSIQTRYLLRVIQGGFSFDSPWSEYVPPAPDATDPLILVEPQP